MIRILLVDDQNLVRQGIKSLLERDPEIKVIGTFKDGRAAVMEIEQLRPDIVLLDIEMPGMNGITATKYITRLSPQTKVIILSSHEDKKYLTQALMAGAKAYILKNSLMTDLKQSIIAVNNGYSHIESRLLAKIFAPSNLKQNSRKKPPQNSRQGKIVTHKPESRTFAKADRIEQSELANAEPSMRTIQSNIITQFNSINSETVPKINLPYSDLEHTDDLVLEGDRNSAVIEKKPLLPAAMVRDRASQLFRIVNRGAPKSMLAIDDAGSVRQIALLILAKYKILVRLWTAKRAQDRSFIDRAQEEFIDYQTKVVPLLKKWQEKGWLANIGLAILGLITAIIIYLMFA